MKKKLTLLVLSSLLFLCGCSDKNSENSASNNPSDTTADTSGATEEVKDVYAVTLKGETVMNVGASQTLVAAVTKNGEADSTGVTFSTSNEAIASVDGSGVVEARTSGSVTITATCNADNNAKAALTIEVKDVYTMSFNAPTAAKVGDDFSLSAEIYKNNVKIDEAVTYTSSDIEIATVDATTGSVHFAKSGTVVLTCTMVSMPEINKAATVTVSDKYTVEIEPEPTTVFYRGDTYQLPVFVHKNGIKDETLTMTYVSSNETIATVSATGLVTCVEYGNFEITVTSVDDPTATVTFQGTVKSFKEETDNSGNEGGEDFDGTGETPKEPGTGE